MKYAFMAAHLNTFSLKLMCCVLRVSRSGWYAWRKRPESNRTQQSRLLLENIQAVHKGSRSTYGSPRVHKQLLQEGHRCSRGRVERLMSKYGIRARHRRRFTVTTDSRHDLPVAGNILKREFKVDGPDKVWAADITYIPTNEGWLYLAGVLDLCTRRIVGWSMSESLDRTLVLRALQMAYQRRKPAAGLIHHSDRGSQYASDDYRKLLKSYGMRMSMSRKGNCWDNAPMESFFGTLKMELIHLKKYTRRSEARRDIFDYLEVFYNKERIHSSLGYVSPANFEKQLTAENYK